MFLRFHKRQILPVLAATCLLTASSLAQAQQQPTPTVTVMEAKSADFVVKSRLPGRIKASTVADVRPQVSGIIRERLFEEGSRVEQGQPLYKIEDETYKATMAAARASVAQAKANFDSAELAANRAAELFATRTGSAVTRDNAVAARDGASAALQIAEAQLTSANIDLDRTTIRAPITGVIGLSQTTVGALIGAQQTAALATIRTLDPVYVDVTQSANDLLRWQASGEAEQSSRSANATMILPNNEPFSSQGELKAAEPQVEPTTGMVTLRISFPNPEGKLLPGLYVEVELPQATQKGAYLIPQGAVMRDAQGGAHSWVVENGKVAVRPLTILTASGNDWVVTSGLNEGDRVITSGFQKIAPGAAVEIAPDDAKAPAPAPAPASGGK